MQCVFFAVVTEFIEFKLFLNHLFIAVTVIVDSFAFCTFQFSKIVL